MHVDDDAIPDAHNLKLMSRTFCSVHAEAGFPTCAPHPPCNLILQPSAPCPQPPIGTQPAALYAPAGIPTARPRGYTGRRRGTAARQATAHRCE